MALITYRDAVNQALAEELARDPNVFVMGESWTVQSAYRVTRGLLESSDQIGHRCPNKRSRVLRAGEPQCLVFDRLLNLCSGAFAMGI